MKKLSLQAKVTMTVAALMLLFAACFTVYFPRQQEAAADRALERHAVSLARVLGNLVVAALEFEQPDAAKEAFTSVEGDEDVLYIAVLGPDGKLFASHLAPGSALAPERLQPSSTTAITTTADALHITMPLVRGGQRKGTLVAGISRRSVRAQGVASQSVALGIGGAFVLLGGLMAALLGRWIARPLLGAAGELEQVSRGLLSSAREQEASSAEEAAAVEQTRRSMDTLLHSAQQIADSSGHVLGHAERSTQGSQQIAARIGDLDKLAEGIAELLGTIMKVADKADLLALNASLEGTKAGEAGRGFTLVAAEMRRLAENVMESVNGIRVLMKSTRDASSAAVAASREGYESSQATTTSAREIARHTEEQREATQQVIESMREMSSILHHTLEGIQRTNTSAAQVVGVATRLSELVRPDGHDRARRAS